MRVMVIIKATKNSEAGVMPERGAARRDGQVQRGAGEGRRHARGRGPAPEQQGQARAVRGRQEERHRRPVRGDQGAHRGLLDLAGEVDGGGRRVGAALPRPDARRGVRRSRSARSSRRRTSATSSRRSCAHRKSVCAPRSSGSTGHDA